MDGDWNDQKMYVDVDTATKTVRITPEKDSNLRISYVRQYVFAKLRQPLEYHRSHFMLQRRRAANKLSARA